MGGQSTNPQHHGNQNRSGGSVVAPVYRTIDWNHASRVFGPDIVLDGNGSGIEIRTFPRLLQRTPNPLGIGRTNTDRESGIQGRAFETLSLADPLPRLIPDANGRMSTNSSGTELRKLLTAHEGGNAGHRQGGSFGPPRQCSTLPTPPELTQSY